MHSIFANDGHRIEGSEIVSVYAGSETRGEFYRGEHGEIRWSSNGSVPPADIIRNLGEDEDLHTRLRSADLDKFAKAYRAARAARSPEEIAEERLEARAAFGEGVNVINVITGERYRT